MKKENLITALKEIMGKELTAALITKLHNDSVDLRILNTLPFLLKYKVINVENLNIPYKVEIVDFSGVSESFRKESLKEAVVWKD